jgi:hypothetical protein
MKAELSFTFESLEELHDFTAKMAVPVPLAMPTPAAEAGVVEEPRTTKVRKTKAAVPAPASEPTLPATEQTEFSPAEEQAAVALDKVRAAISAVNEKFGLVPARKVLTQFGVKRIPELRPAQYADFVKACSAVK